MLNGLEAIEIRLSQLERTNRIDPEYFLRTYLQMDALLGKLKTVTLPKVAYVSDGNHFSISEKFQEEGVPYYRGQDISHFFIEQASPICIGEDTFNSPKIKRSHLQKGDVLLSIVGTIGETSLVTTNAAATCSCKLAIFRPYEINSEYLAIFLKSKYGKGQVDRLTRGSVQMGFLLEDTDQILIPVMSNDFQKQVGKIVKTAYAKIETSKSLYAQAEATLLDELGLMNWKPPKESAAIKTFKESFDKSGRLDAEYFHPQKDYAFRWLSKLSGEPISKYFQSIREMYNPPIQDTGKLLQTFDLNHALNYFIEEGDVIPENEIGSTKKRIKYSDVVVSKLRSYLKEIAIVETQKESLGSSEFIVLRSQGKVSPELLMVYLRSEVVQTILRWSQDGSNHPRFQEDELLAIKLPDKVIAVQKDIQKLIRAGVKSSQESKQLLEISKRAVEVAIEKGESKGMKVLEE